MSGLFKIFVFIILLILNRHLSVDALPCSNGVCGKTTPITTYRTVSSSTTASSIPTTVWPSTTAQSAADTTGVKVTTKSDITTVFITVITTDEVFTNVTSPQTLTSMGWTATVLPATNTTKLPEKLISHGVNLWLAVGIPIGILSFFGFLGVSFYIRIEIGYRRQASAPQGVALSVSSPAFTLYDEQEDGLAFDRVSETSC